MTNPPSHLFNDCDEYNDGYSLCEKCHERWIERALFIKAQPDYPGDDVITAVMGLVKSCGTTPKALAPKIGKSVQEAIKIMEFMVEHEMLRN